MSDIEKDVENSESLSKEEKVAKFKADIDKQREEDPLAGIRLGSEDIYKSLMAISMDGSKNVNVHNVVLYAAGLAGYACQMAVVETQLKNTDKSLKDVFQILGSPTGEKYYFSEYMNDYIFGNKYSVWNLLVSMFNHVYPDLEAPNPSISVKRMTANIANPEYRVVGEQVPDILAEMFAIIWDKNYEKMCLYCPNPEEWPVLYSMVLQKCLVAAKGMIEPAMCMNFILEVVLFASKADISSKEV